MLSEDKERIINFYENCLKREKGEVRRVGWRSRERQNLRFQILCEIGNLTNTSILDIGCGLGALGEFLRKKMPLDYTGYEICGKMANEARKLRPYLKIKEVDILEKKVKERFDWVLSSGIFNLRLKDNFLFLEEVLNKSFQFCKLGAAFNMLSTYVDYQDPNLYYVKPEKVFSLAKKISKRVVLRYDYMPYEFTIYLYKTDFNPEVF